MRKRVVHGVGIRGHLRNSAPRSPWSAAPSVPPAAATPSSATCDAAPSTANPGFTSPPSAKSATCTSGANVHARPKAALVPLPRTRSETTLFVRTTAREYVLANRCSVSEISHIVALPSPTTCSGATMTVIESSTSSRALPRSSSVPDAMRVSSACSVASNSAASNTLYRANRPSASEGSTSNRFETRSTSAPSRALMRTSETADVVSM
mmetsp:Transcript_5687/g.20402  ORF Transcript_5687/g.20402 Transcript_5687/m.20402 type:complete len:209 (+) Transcript_5687:199-825(+)